MIEEVVGPGGERLATVLRLDAAAEGLHFFSRPDDILQVGVIVRPTGFAVAPHQHRPRVRVTEGTAEVLVVLSGMVGVHVYAAGAGDDPPYKVRRVRLGAGDAVVFHPGSVHGVQVLHDARIVEVKSGPYTDRTEDKVTGEE